MLRKRLLAAPAAAVLTIALGGLALLAPTAAYAHDTTAAKCVPSPASEQKVVTTAAKAAVAATPGTEAVVAVAEVSELVTTSYVWRGGPIDAAPTAVPATVPRKEDPWQLRGKPHGGETVNTPLQEGTPGGADWFYWLQVKNITTVGVEGKDAVIGTEGSAAVAEVSTMVKRAAVTCTAANLRTLPLSDPETLAETGASESAGIVGLVALLLTMAGVGMVAARRRVEV